MLSAIARCIPLLGEMRAYRVATLRSDLVAAMTVAIVVLPQSMAYALIAGADPVYGLYAAIVTAIVGSFFGSSNHLITGPTNALALMIAAAMKHHTGSPDFYPTLFLLTFMTGAIQFALAALRFGKIVNLVSHSVIVGFTAGAGIIIGLGQLNGLLGIGLPGGYHPLYEKVLLTLRVADATNLYALGLGVLTIAIILGARCISRRIPGALLALVVCAALARCLGLDARGVRLVGDIPSHLPRFSMVSFDLGLAWELAGAAVAIAVVGLVEAIAISKSIALSSEQSIDSSQEFLGQGLANLAGSFFGCFPSSGSFTRSAINYGAGAQTKMAGILSGLLVAITMLLLASHARYIPMASLAGVIVVVAYYMVDQHAIARIMRASRHDMGVMLVTAGATVVMPDLERAIVTGVVVSVLVHVWNTGEIKVRLLTQHGATFRETDLGAATRLSERLPIAIIHLDGDLYFGSTQSLQDGLRQAADRIDAKVYIIRLKRVNIVDVSAFEILENFIEKTQAKGRHVLLCGVGPAMLRFLGKIGLIHRIGEDNVFPAEDRIYASTLKAYRRAETLLASHPGTGAGP